MSEFMFLTSRERLTAAQRKTYQRVAKNHDVSFVEVTLPGTGYQRWFSGPNMGTPFDQRLANAVAHDLGLDEVL